MARPPTPARLILDDRALNRATLARQLLLERAAMAPVDAVVHLVGLQAQNPHDPYLALWSRLDGFDPESLSARIAERDLVRIVAMRGTIHLLTADDACELRPLSQPVLDAEIARHSQFAPLLAGVDLDPPLRAARELLAEQPMTTTKLRQAVAERFPDLDAAAVVYAARCHLPLVQVPPRGLWGRSAAVTYAVLDDWAGRPVSTAPSVDRAVLRYLAAFGPATVADAATWCRLTGLREVFARLRPSLRCDRDERGRELFDLPDAPRPHPDVPAPVRFLPEYDNVLLSHADRSRFGRYDIREVADAGPTPRGTVLVDGVVAARWHTDRAAGGLVVEHRKLPKRAVAAVEEEAGRVARLLHGDGAGVVLAALDETALHDGRH